MLPFDFPKSLMCAVLPSWRSADEVPNQRTRPNQDHVVILPSTVNSVPVASRPCSRNRAKRAAGRADRPNENCHETNLLVDTCSIWKMHFRVNQVRMRTQTCLGPLIAAAFHATSAASNLIVNGALNTSSVRVSMAPIKEEAALLTMVSMHSSLRRPPFARATFPPFLFVTITIDVVQD